MTKIKLVSKETIISVLLVEEIYLEYFLSTYGCIDVYIKCTSQYQ